MSSQQLKRKDIPSPLVPKIPLFSPTNAQLKGPYETVTLAVPVTPKEDYPQITKVFQAATASNNTVVLYTVPTGKQFILYSAGMCCVDITGSSSQGRLFGPLSSDEIIEYNNYGRIETIPQNCDFGIPIYFNEGESISVKSQSANLKATGMIRGYEIDKFSGKSQIKLDEWLLFRGFLNIYKD